MKGLIKPRNDLSIEDIFGGVSMEACHHFWEKIQGKKWGNSWLPLESNKRVKKMALVMLFILNKIIPGTPWYLYSSLRMKHKNFSINIIEFVLSRGIKDFSELTAGKIARHFNMKISYISREFKNDTKILLSKFIVYERIKRAEELIKIRSDLPIEDIAKRVGFETCHHFRKIFKEKNGVTPGIYRKIIKKIVNKYADLCQNPDTRCTKCKTPMESDSSFSEDQNLHDCPRIFRYTVGCCR